MKVDDGELPEDADAGQDGKEKGSAVEGVNGTGAVVQSDRNLFNSHQSGWSKRDGNQRTSKAVKRNVFSSMSGCISKNCWSKVVYLKL